MALGGWPNNLPEQFTSFVGRVREREQARAGLATTRLVVLTGAGGAGKTRLALAVAADSSDLFPDGAWWVELAPLVDDESVGEALASVLGVRPLPGRTQVEAAVGRLAEDRALVVLDNCEQVLEAAGDLTEALLRGCPRVVVLATSRAPLGVPGESDWRVPALSLPGHSGLESPAAVMGSDAGGLFVERAVKVRPDFVLGHENAPVVARICRELDGIPLAIELAAARVRMLSPWQIADGLGDRFRLLTGGPRGVLARQQTLRASVEWSHGLLSDEGRLLFRRLAVFAGGWSLQAVESVCAGNGLEGGALLDLLASLVDRSLVVVEGHDRVARYRLLETLRQYAVELLEQSGEVTALRDRHLEFFLALAERGATELEVPRDLEWLGVLEADAANFDAAIEHGVVSGPERALRMAVALSAWWEVTGRFPAGEGALGRALSAADPAPSSLRARALWSRAQFARYRRDYETADALSEEAHDVAEAVGDRPTLARSLRQQGAMRMQQDPSDSRRLFRRAYELARDSGDAGALMPSATTFAWSYLWTDDYAEAERLLDEAQPALERAGIRGSSWSGFARSWCAAVRGEHARCREFAEEAIAAAPRLTDPVAEAFAHTVIAWDDSLQGRSDEALARMLASEARLIAAGAGMALPYIRKELASAYAALGDLDRARDILAAVVVGGTDASWTYCQSLLNLADVLRALGDVDGALARSREALELSERIKSRLWLAASRELLARLAIARGEWSKAEALAHQALALRLEIDARVYLPQSLDPLAQVAHGLESHAEAARLLGAAERGRTDLGLVRWAPDAPALATLAERLEVELGADAYAEAHGAGAAMSLHEAIGWVRRARGTRKRPAGGWESLTPTELRVVELVGQGLTNPQVAERMFVSRATVKAHLAHVFQKLDVNSRSELAAMAVRHEG